MAISSYIRRQFKNAVSVVDTLPSGLGAGALACTFQDGSTFPDGSVGPFVCVLDQGLASEEKILMSSRSGAAGTIAANGRGYNGTVNQNHGTNCTILHTIDQQDLDEANQAVVNTIGLVQAQGDIIVGASANTFARLAKGAANSFLTAGGSTLQYTPYGSGGTSTVAAAASDGTANNPARYDHVHAQQAGVMFTTTYDAAAIAQQVLGTTATQTTSNKRITKRVVTVTQSATPAINTDNTDVASITGLAQAITSMTTSLTGTPNAGDTLIVQITDNGTARAITWGASFESSGNVALPNTTVISTELTTGFQWNPATSKWRCVGLA